MEELTQEEKDKIVQALKDKGATRACPRCGEPNFTLIDGYFSHFLQRQLGGMTIGGPSIPTAVVACSRCGWLAEHALGGLGLLPGEPEAEEQDQAQEEKP